MLSSAKKKKSELNSLEGFFFQDKERFDIDITQDLVSVIINVHNGCEYLEEAILSVIGQSYRNIELIVYDNFSTDNTRKISEKYIDYLSYFYSNKFLTLPEARIAAISISQGKYLAFLDSDDFWHKEKIKKQVEQANNQDDFVMSWTNSYKLYENKLIRDEMAHSLHFNYQNFVDTLFLNNPIVFSSTFFSRSAYFSVGGFDKSYKSSIDYDLYIKFLKIGKINYLDEFLTIYRVHKKNLSKLESMIIYEDNVKILGKNLAHKNAKKGFMMNKLLLSISIAKEDKAWLDIIYLIFTNLYCFISICKIIFLRFFYKEALLTKNFNLLRSDNEKD